MRRGAASIPLAFRFHRHSDEIRARITKAASASQDIRIAIFERAILAVPILATFDHGAPGCHVGRRRRQAETKKPTVTPTAEIMGAIVTSVACLSKYNELPG